METIEQPVEKKLWGTPLKLKQAEEKIVALEAENAELKKRAIVTTEIGEMPALYSKAHPVEGYEFEVWRRDRARTEMGPDGKPVLDDNGEPVKKPVHWRHFHADGTEWVYHEKQNFMNDSGYGSFIDDRVTAMVKNAFRSLKNPNLYYERFGPEVRTANGQPTGTSDYSKLPKFDPEERVIEIIVRIR